MGSSIGKGSSNFLDTLPIQGTVHLVMLGLDSAGKTTALYRLKFDQYLNTVPTIGFNCEKVQGALGKSKGIQFLVWDVGGQEKLRPLWRSYTRCTDGILFVVDSVDTERMEEAKMELMKTAKCPENQGVPVLILANKQDLPGARDSKELEKLLGLNELAYSSFNSFNADSSGKIVNSSKNSQTSSSSSNLESNFRANVLENIELKNAERLLPSSKPTIFVPNADEAVENKGEASHSHSNCKSLSTKLLSSFPASNTSSTSDNGYFNKRWYIQPTCAITGDGLQEGLEALYNMILKRKKISKALKKKR